MNLCSHPCLYSFSLLFKGSNSKWWTYINTLPILIDSVINFTEEEVQLLQPSRLHVIAEAARSQIHSDWERIVIPLREQCGEFFLNDGFNYENYKWAITMLLSRGSSVRFGCKKQKRDYWIILSHFFFHSFFSFFQIIHLSPASSLVTLLPFFDMANHKPGVNVTHEFVEKEGVLKVVARQRFAAGSQFFLNYGNVSSARVEKITLLSLIILR